MSIIRVGATKKYSDGWETAFGKGKKKPATAIKAKAAKKSTKKAAGKKTAKKRKK
ncbi:MAG: hypothetical protein WD845_06590 [Pirellulales bacterium]